MKMNSIVALSLTLLLPLAALASGGSYRCEGTRHPSGTDEPPRAFALPDVSAATRADAEDKTRHQNTTDGYTTDSVSCREQPDAAGGPGNYVCRGKIDCQQASTGKTDGCTARRTDFYADSDTKAERIEIGLCEASVNRKNGRTRGDWTCSAGSGFTCFKR